MRASILRNGLVAACAAILLASAAAQACTVPVFRYALERWPADPYDLVVFHNGGLGEAEQGLLDTIDEQFREGTFFANIYLTKLDMADEEDKATAERVLGAAPEELPLMAILPPDGAARGQAIWQGALTAENLKSVIESPARREVAKRILSGETGVWLLLESGDKSEDDKAEEQINAVLKEAEENLRLPDVAPEDMEYLTQGEGVPGLRIDFSVLRVSRDDPAEAFLVESLLRTEDDLKQFDSPMCFPVYGRGRALDALVGPGINEQNIADYCMFLAGACSCQIKEWNPGADLLVAADWDGLMGGRLALNEALPELSGFAGFAPVAEPVIETAADRVEVQAAPEAENASAAETPAEVPAASMDRKGESAAAQTTSKNLLAMNGLLVAAIGLGFIAGCSMLLWMKKG